MWNTPDRSVPKSLALHRAAGGQRERAHRASMEGAVKRNELVALGVKFHELDGRFDSLGARIAEVNALGFLAGRNASEFFRQLNQLG